MEVWVTVTIWGFFVEVTVDEANDDEEMDDGEEVDEVAAQFRGRSGKEAPSLNGMLADKDYFIYAIV